MKTVHRITAGLISIGVLLSAVFLTIVRIVINITGLENAMEIKLSVKTIIEYYRDGVFSSISGSSLELAEGVKEYLPRLITTGVFIVLALVCALVIIVLCIATKKQWPTFWLSVAGLVSIVGAFIAFSPISTAVSSGTLDISSLLDLGLLAGILVGSFISIPICQLSSALFVIAFLYVILAMLTVLFIFMEDDPKKSKVKKAKAK